MVMYVSLVAINVYSDILPNSIFITLLVMLISQLVTSLLAICGSLMQEFFENCIRTRGSSFRNVSYRPVVSQIQVFLCFLSDLSPHLNLMLLH